MSTGLIRIGALVAALAAMLALAACGEKEEGNPGRSEQLHLTLDFYPNPDHAGIYMARRLGHFREAGLDVEIEAPSDPAAPIKQVAAGQTDLAISYEPEVLLARDRGLPVKAVAAIVDRPLTSMIWLRESGIDGIGDLRGKTVATAGIPYQDAYLETILARANVSPRDVRAVNVGLGLLPAIVGGRAQALLGAFRNIEGVDLRLRGKEPQVTPVDRLGVPTYNELVLVANEDLLEEDPERVRLFIAALERGTRAAAENPGAATDAVLGANRGLERRLTAAETRATLPLLYPRRPGRPFGYMDPGQWREFAAWMRDNDQLGALLGPARVMSNAYLPGEIPE